MLSIPTAHNLLEQDNSNHVQCRFAGCAVERKQLSVDYRKASQRTVVTNRTTLLVLTSGTTRTTRTRIPNETGCCIDERAQTSNGREKTSCLSSSRYLKKRAGTRRIGRKRKARWAGIVHPTSAAKNPAVEEDTLCRSGLENTAYPEHCSINMSDRRTPDTPRPIQPPPRDVSCESELDELKLMKIV